MSYTCILFYINRGNTLWNNNNSYIHLLNFTWCQSLRFVHRICSVQFFVLSTVLPAFFSCPQICSLCLYVHIVSFCLCTTTLWLCIPSLFFCTQSFCSSVHTAFIVGVIFFVVHLYTIVHYPFNMDKPSQYFEKLLKMDDATLVQHLEQLGFARTSTTSQLQTPRATLAHSGMTSNYFIASKPSWIVDSGATDHIIGNQGILSGLTFTSQSPVQIINGSTCNIEGTGSTHISKNIPLPSVLYVPSFPENVLSDSKITEQLYCSVTFTPTKYVFQELGTNRLIGNVYKEQGLYRMESSPQWVAYLSTVSAKKVHSQLGHLSLQVLKKIRPEF